MGLFRENIYEAQFMTTKEIQEERSIRMGFQAGIRMTITLKTNSDVFFKGWSRNNAGNKPWWRI